MTRKDKEHLALRHGWKSWKEMMEGKKRIQHRRELRRRTEHMYYLRDIIIGDGEVLKNKGYKPITTEGFESVIRIKK